MRVASPLCRASRARAGRGGAGVGGELLQGLAQGAGLAFGPGRVQLALLRLTGAAEDAEPEQGAGGRHAQ